MIVTLPPSNDQWFLRASTTNAPYLSNPFFDCYFKGSHAVFLGLRCDKTSNHTWVFLPKRKRSHPPLNPNMYCRDEQCCFLFQCVCVYLCVYTQRGKIKGTLYVFILPFMLKSVYGRLFQGDLFQFLFLQHHKCGYKVAQTLLNACRKWINKS